jgi:hypothetical protein
MANGIDDKNLNKRVNPRLLPQLHSLEYPHFGILKNLYPALTGLFGREVEPTTPVQPTTTTSGGGVLDILPGREAMSAHDYSLGRRLPPVQPTTTISDAPSEISGPSDAQVIEDISGPSTVVDVYGDQATVPTTELEMRDPEIRTGQLGPVSPDRDGGGGLGILDILGQLIGDPSIQRFMGTALTGAIGGGGPKGARNVQEFNKVFNLGLQLQREQEESEYKKALEERRVKVLEQEAGTKKQQLIVSKGLREKEGLSEQIQMMTAAGRNTPDALKKRYAKAYGIDPDADPGFLDFRPARYQISPINPYGAQPRIIQAWEPGYGASLDERQYEAWVNSDLTKKTQMLDAYRENIKRNPDVDPRLFAEVFIGSPDAIWGTWATLEGVSPDGKPAVYLRNTSTGDIHLTGITPMPTGGEGTGAGRVSPDAAKLIANIQDSGLPQIDELIGYLSNSEHGLVQGVEIDKETGKVTNNGEFITSAKVLLASNGARIATSLVPGAKYLWGQTAKAAQLAHRFKVNIADILGRIRSGGAIGDEEMNNFELQLGLALSDTLVASPGETIAALRRIRSLFKGIADRLEVDNKTWSTDPDYYRDITQEALYGNSSARSSVVNGLPPAQGLILYQKGSS